MEPERNIGRDDPGDKRDNPAATRSQQMLAAELERFRAEARRRSAELAQEGEAPRQAYSARAAAAAQARPGVAAAQPFAAIANRLPIAGKVAAGRVAHPKVHDSSIRPLSRRVDLSSWRTALRSRARARVLGDPRETTLRVIGQELAYLVEKTRNGFARIGFVSLARLAGCCRETARRAVRCLERLGVLDTLNVLVRRDGLLERDVNLYVPALPEPDPDQTADELAALAPRLERIAGYGRAWGLVLRDGGLNPVTPRSSRRRDRPPL